MSHRKNIVSAPNTNRTLAFIFTFRALASKRASYMNESTRELFRRHDVSTRINHMHKLFISKTGSQFLNPVW